MAYILLSLILLVISAKSPLLAGVAGSTFENEFDRVNPGIWASQLSLQVGRQHLCGAVLISRNLALTAAHCTDGLPSLYELVMGRRDVGSPDKGYRRRITHIHRHPDPLEHDVSLLRLESPVVLSDSVQPIRLADDKQTFRGAKCYVTGWALKESRTREMQDVLQHVEVKVISGRLCGEMLKAPCCLGFPSSICVIASSSGKRACSGDSGGALYCQYEGNGPPLFVGFTSWVIKAGYIYNQCLPKKPSVYSRVNEYSDWLSRIRRLIDDTDLDEEKHTTVSGSTVAVNNSTSAISEAGVTTYLTEVSREVTSPPGASGNRISTGAHIDPFGRSERGPNSSSTGNSGYNSGNRGITGNSTDTETNTDINITTLSGNGKQTTRVTVSGHRDLTTALRVRRDFTSRETTTTYTRPSSLPSDDNNGGYTSPVNADGKWGFPSWSTLNVNSGQTGLSKGSANNVDTTASVVSGKRGHTYSLGDSGSSPPDSSTMKYDRGYTDSPPTEKTAESNPETPSVYPTYTGDEDDDSGSVTAPANRGYKFDTDSDNVRYRVSVVESGQEENSPYTTGSVTRWDEITTPRDGDHEYINSTVESQSVTTEETQVNKLIIIRKTISVGSALRGNIFAVIILSLKTLILITF